MNAAAAWWRARTGREQLILRVGAGVIALALVPVWAYVTAASFRRDAAADLASARLIETQVARLAEASRAQGAPMADADPSVRGRALAAAEATGLEPARIEPAGPERVRIAFQPADSLSVYRWIDQVGRRGAYVARTSITRIQDSEQVQAEFEVASGP